MRLDDSASGAHSIAFLEMDRRPSLLLNAQLEVKWINSAALAYLAEPGPVTLADNRLAFADSKLSEAWVAALANVSNTPRQFPVLDGKDVGAILRYWTGNQERQRHIYVTIAALGPGLAAAESGLAEAYHLTPAEGEILDDLLHALSPEEVAARRGRSVHTIRTHVRRIYKKVGVRSQTQLLRLALLFSGQ